MQAAKLDNMNSAPAHDMIALAPGIEFRGVRMRFEHNEEIFGEDEAAEYVYRVASGAVRTMRFTADGRRQILGFHLPGDIIGLELGQLHTLSAEAVAATALVMVRRSVLDKAASEDPRTARALLALIANNLDHARQHAMVLGRKGASKRVAAFLLGLADRTASQQDVDLPMSRADIGDYLGLTIESVSRSFSDMERQRTIALPTSRHVVMKSRSALAQL